jgi:hypothetical protein
MHVRVHGPSLQARISAASVNPGWFMWQHAFCNRLSREINTPLPEEFPGRTGYGGWLARRHGRQGRCSRNLTACMLHVACCGHTQHDTNLEHKAPLQVLDLLALLCLHTTDRSQQQQTMIVSDDAAALRTTCGLQSATRRSTLNNASVRSSRCMYVSNEWNTTQLPRSVHNGQIAPRGPASREREGHYLDFVGRSEELLRLVGPLRGRQGGHGN